MEVSPKKTDNKINAPGCKTESSQTIENLELDEASIHRAVFEDRVAQFMVRERNVSISGPLVSAYAAFLHYGAIDLHILILWWLALLLCDGTTFITSSLYLHRPKKDQALQWLKRVFWAQSCAGVVWGLSVFLFKVPGDFKHELYTLVILVAVSSVTSVALLPFRSAFIGFLLGIWAFPFLYFLYLGEIFYLNLAIGIVIMGLTLIGYQSISTRQFVDGIEQKLRASMLANQLDRALQKLEKLAIYDELTSVYNRRFGLDSLQKEKRLQERLHHPLSIAMIDLDHFKSINDNYGHAAGDQALICFAQCVTSELREGDTFFRYGGEEFLLLMPNTSLDQAMVVAERLRTAIYAAQSPPCCSEIKLSASIGIAETPAHENIEKAIDRADKAMYAAKQNGRNRVEVAPSLPATG